MTEAPQVYTRPMDRRALPLLLASERFISDDESEPLDRVRTQKGVFLLEERGPTRWRHLYGFSPYDWGPFSRELAGDIDEMLGHELRFVRFEGFRYGEFRTTSEGEEQIHDLIDALPDRTLQFVQETRRFVTTRAFSRLLREVYAAYPEYATRSRFTG